MESLVQDVSNVGITILCVVIGVIIVNWLDRNIFNNHHNRDRD